MRRLSQNDFIHYVRKAAWTGTQAACIFSGIVPTSPRYDLERDPDVAAHYKGTLVLMRDYFKGERLSALSRHPSEWIDWVRASGAVIDGNVASFIASHRATRMSVHRQQNNCREGTDTQDKAADPRVWNTVLRIIRALDVMAKLPVRGAAGSIEKQLQELGFSGPKDATIRSVLDEARKIEPDR